MSANTEQLRLNKFDFTTEAGRDAFIIDTMKALMGEHNSQSNMDILDEAYDKLKRMVADANVYIDELDRRFEDLKELFYHKTNIFTIDGELQQIVEETEYYIAESSEMESYTNNMLILLSLPKNNGGKAIININKLGELTLKRVNYEYNGFEDMEEMDVKEGIYYLFKIVDRNLVLINDSIYKANKDGSVQNMLNAQFLGGTDLEGIYYKTTTELEDHDNGLDAHDTLVRTLSKTHISAGEPGEWREGDSWQQIVGEDEEGLIVQMRYRNGTTGEADALFPITTLENVKELPQALDDCKKYVDEHNHYEDAHPHLSQRITQVEAKVDRVEDMIVNNVRGNTFMVTFEDLDDVKVTGVWNEEQKRIEF